MKRTRIFTFVMAIVWTVIGGLAIVLALRSGLNSGMNVLLVLLAVVAVAGNWLRWVRSR